MLKTEKSKCATTSPLYFENTSQRHVDSANIIANKGTFTKGIWHDNNTSYKQLISHDSDIINTMPVFENDFGVYGKQHSPRSMLLKGEDVLPEINMPSD